MFTVFKDFTFAAAHQIRGHRGGCENLHGHNYKVEIYARGEELNNIGLLIDFGDLKKAADEIVNYLDHRNLNELPPFEALQQYMGSGGGILYDTDSGYHGISFSLRNEPAQ